MTRTSRLLSRAAAATAALTLSVAGLGAGTLPARAASSPAPGVCPPAGRAVSFSDALDKLSYGGVTGGGLSSLAYDRHLRAWASTVDNHGNDPSRIWFFRNLSAPRVVRSPLVLRRPDGTAYDGTTADNEGLAVLPGGRFVVSSETEPSIRIFGRDGRQQASLPVPARFAVTGTTAAGQATTNATLEGLTLSRDGRHLVAAMEGALSGDVSSTGDATLHRFLVYDHSRSGWRLRKQIAYRAETGQRVPEVAAVGRHDLIVEEASFAVGTGNVIQLYAVRDYDRAPNVSRVRNLSTAPASVVAGKRLLADLVRCPSLGATSKEPQVNPLLDNFEGMAVTGTHPGRHGRSRVGVSLISDDNFSSTQTTRVLNLTVELGRCG